MPTTRQGVSSGLGGTIGPPPASAAATAAGDAYNSVTVCPTSEPGSASFIRFAMSRLNMQVMSVSLGKNVP